MFETRTPSDRITEAVSSWPGVEAGPGSRGEFGFRVGRREVGHLHGDRAAHFAFPRRVAAELKEQGRVGTHPVDSPGLVARTIDDENDVRDVIALMRASYDRIVGRHGLPADG